VLGDLGYEGEADTITVAFKKPKDGDLSDPQKTYNRTHNSIRAIAERGKSLLKMTFKALRNVSLCPWNLGRIVAAALVLLHVDHDPHRRHITCNGRSADRGKSGYPGSRGSLRRWRHGCRSAARSGRPYDAAHGRVGGSGVGCATTGR
jgi:hypothetical protein